MTDLITQGCQVSLKAFMFTLQCLNTGQVMTVVVSVECLVLLLNPLFSFISIPVEEQTQSWLKCYKENLLKKCDAEAADTQYDGSIMCITAHILNQRSDAAAFTFGLSGNGSTNVKTNSNCFFLTKTVV